VTGAPGVPKVLDWAQRLQAIAQNGLAYQEPTEFDRDRYEQVRGIAAEMLAQGNGLAAEELVRVFASQSGHATPKVDVRGAVFRDDEILLVRERADGRWTLPGGWADVGESPSEAVTREVLEESGYATRATKLLALYDRDRHGHPPHPWHTWKVVFLCELLGEEQRALGAETLAADFFPPDRLPELSLSRVTPRQIARFFEHREHPEWPTDFD
jgi:ADP-ribose pyrophosphatase YjhB (NUDIX family)